MGEVDTIPSLQIKGYYLNLLNNTLEIHSGEHICQWSHTGFVQLSVFFIASAGPGMAELRPVLFL